MLPVNPDHFDAKKFDRDGRPICATIAKKPSGKRSRLRPEDVPQLLFLDQLAKAASRDVADYLDKRGFNTPTQRSNLLGLLRKGWRPK